MFEELVAQALHEGAGDALVAATENGHAASAVLQFAGQHLGHRCFACAADGEVPDADHRATEFLGAQQTAAVESEPRLDGAFIQAGEAAEDKLEGVGASAFATLENDVDGVALEAFENDPHGQPSIVTPRLSAPSTWTRAAGRMPCMAAATGAGSVKVMQATADPDPLR